MSTHKFFDPSRISSVPVPHRAGDESYPADGEIYIYHNPDVVLAVNVAMATGRPLLLSGPSGCGKSALARNVAGLLGYRYYEHVITARTEARDLLYRFDTVRRLNDAQVTTAGEMPPLARYVEPGALWWALSPETAVQRGSATPLPLDFQAADPSGIPGTRGAVVLLDEIDKADPDLPNSLLVPLGAFRFRVDPLDIEITAEPGTVPLIFITNNGERELPTTFVRRCISLTLQSPGEDDLLAIAQAVVPTLHWNEPLFRTLARNLVRSAGGPIPSGGQRSSTAEFLDAVKACCELGIASENDPDFQMLLQMTMVKPQPGFGSPM